MAESDLEDTFMTVADVAEILKLNQQTVRNWIDQGSLPATRVGRRVRIRRSDFERVLANGSTGRAAGAGSVPGPDANDFWGGEPVGRAEFSVSSEHEDLTRGSAQPAPNGGGMGTQ